jgi:hypothetical protein
MPLNRPKLTNAYDPLGLFGDGPPTWTINKGKLGERPSFSCDEVLEQRDGAAFKLRWHEKHMASLAGNETATSLAARALANKLDACSPPNRPCLSGACPICMRAQQRWLVMDTVHVHYWIWLDNPTYSPQALSLVPVFGQILVGSLHACDVDKFRSSVRDALRACGIRDYKLGLDISLDQPAGVAGPGFWQLQLWGLFHDPETPWHEPKTPWHEHLKALVDPKDVVTNPVWVRKPRSLEAAAAYGLKSTFDRRVGYWKTYLHREACWNTRDRILRGEPWVELMLFLDRIGLERRLLLSGRHLSVPPLRSWKGLRLVAGK